MKILKLIDPEEIKEINDLAEEALKHEIVLPGYATYSCTVYDPEGNPTAYYEDKSRSFTRNYYNFVIAMNIFVFRYVSSYSIYGFDDGKLGWKKTSSAVYNIAIMNNNDIVIETNSDANYGILVGSNNTAESLNDYMLYSKIQNGTGSGKLNYQAMSSPTVSWVAGSKRFSAQHKRYFSNNSGGTITVREIGMFARPDTSDGSSYVCFIRDVPSSGIEIPNTYDLKVQYTLYGPVYP